MALADRARLTPDLQVVRGGLPGVDMAVGLGLGLQVVYRPTPERIDPSGSGPGRPNRSPTRPVAGPAADNGFVRRNEPPPARRERRLDLNPLSIIRCVRWLRSARRPSTALSGVIGFDPSTSPEFLTPATTARHWLRSAHRSLIGPPVVGPVGRMSRPVRRSDLPKSVRVRKDRTCGGSIPPRNSITKNPATTHGGRE